ncbi:MAG: hypothetical protein JNJ57_05755, partial [Saprospiraceae bacterium]|nr:hypothetical protein [Saprospiraceae bacterium]
MSYIFLLLALLFTSFPSFSQAPPIQWQKNLGGSNNDWYTTVKITPDGGSVFAGMTLSSDGDIGSNLGG